MVYVNIQNNSVYIKNKTIELKLVIVVYKNNKLKVKIVYIHILTKIRITLFLLSGLTKEKSFLKSLYPDSGVFFKRNKDLLL